MIFYIFSSFFLTYNKRRESKSPSLENTGFGYRLITLVSLFCTFLLFHFHPRSIKLFLIRV